MNDSKHHLEDDIHLAAAILSKKYEDQLFNQGQAHNRVVPALVITGFLGAGKTTLLQHLLATCGSELKLGVLVNEVAEDDVDSQLLNASSNNAAAGIKSAQLSGGCACCAVSSDLSKALAELVGSSSYQHLDQLLLETSGVADAGPLAASLSVAGFRLTGVVTVVDVEAGLDMLQQNIAQAQLRAADIVVLNKCDLASLSAVSTVEDKVQELAPGVKMLRARHGQVPAEALLEVDVPEYEAGGDESEASTGASAGCAQGEIAFLSHEPVVSTSSVKARNRPGNTPLWRRAAVSPDSASQHTQHGTTHQHSSFGSVSFLSTQPLCMACFQSFVSHQLTAGTGLFRAKGFVWFQQLRDQRYVFHLSGKQRVECGSEGRWQVPPKVQLVLIGQNQQPLLQLKAGLQECVAGTCPCSTTNATLPVAANCGAEAGSAAFVTSETADTVAGQHRSHHTCSAVSRIEELISKHQWLDLYQDHQGLQQPQQQQAPNQPAQQSTKLLPCVPCGVVQFTARGSVLHGVVAEEVNSKLLQRANAAAGIFVCHIKSPAALQVPMLQHARYQGVSALQLCLGGTQTVRDVEQWWGQFLSATAPVLRTAYQHVHNCSCDVAATH